MHAAITVSFQQPSYTVSEGAGSVEVCLIIDSGGVDSEKPVGVEVDVTPRPVTATEGKLACMYIWATVCLYWSTPIYTVFYLNSITWILCHIQVKVIKSLLFEYSQMCMYTKSFRS